MVAVSAAFLNNMHPFKSAKYSPQFIFLNLFTPVNFPLFLSLLFTLQNVGIHSVAANGEDTIYFVTGQESSQSDVYTWTPSSDGTVAAPDAYVTVQGQSISDVDFS